MTRLATCSFALAALLWTAPQTASADVFVLTTGGQIAGELLNPDEIPRKVYIIETSPGSQITLNRAQVRKILHPREEELQYDQIRPTFPDTIEGQWTLAVWCLEHRLTEQRKVHLHRVIELDPDHIDARAALGYGQINGRWMTQDEVMTERGYIRYNGRWLTVQEISLIENRREIDLAETKWAQNVKRWRSWLEDERADEAYESLMAIDDPHAVPALAASLQEEPVVKVRILYVEVLANLGTPEAIQALAVCSLDDPSEEVRLNCLDFLETTHNPQVVAYYVSHLRSKDNLIINLAAKGLGRMNDPSAIGPLIDALVTVHTYQQGNRNPGAMSVQFPTNGTPGGGGMSFNDKPKTVDVARKNQEVLDALVALTGQNFNFDQQAWSYWHAAQRRPAEIDARRD